jgi:hypothetical protein
MQHLWYNPTAAGSCDIAPKTCILLNEKLPGCLSFTRCIKSDDCRKKSPHRRESSYDPAFCDVQALCLPCKRIEIRLPVKGIRTRRALAPRPWMPHVSLLRHGLDIQAVIPGRVPHVSLLRHGRILPKAIDP